MGLNPDASEIDSNAGVQVFGRVGHRGQGLRQQPHRCGRSRLGRVCASGPEFPDPPLMRGAVSHLMYLCGAVAVACAGQPLQQSDAGLQQLSELAVSLGGPRACCVRQPCYRRSNALLLLCG